MPYSTILEYKILVVILREKMLIVEELKAMIMWFVMFNASL